MQTGMAFMASKTLLSAVEVEVFTELTKGTEDLKSLSGRLGIHPRSTRDFFDTLFALGFLECANGKYSNTPSTDLFLDKRKPSYIGGMLEMTNKRLYPFWGRLTTGLRTGERQNEEPGTENLFAAFYSDPARLKEFLRAMTGISHGAKMAIAAQLPWDKYKTAADCGTAQGDLIVQIALKNPHIKGIGFDLAEVAPIFEEYVEQNGLSERVKFQAGSFFTDPLPKVDVITMGHILHDWNLEEKKMLIRKAYEALPEGGAFVAYDCLIDDDRCKNVFGLLMSLNMPIETPGGFDYAGADGISWMKEAGFREVHVEHLAGLDSMVVGIK
ncbi:MAG: methyltransferase domain-containing protein [Acidobacteriota bacterium]|nr:methyltransferase domain-containing protein [Acidobacteriota bacterium]